MFRTERECDLMVRREESKTSKFRRYRENFRDSKRKGKEKLIKITPWGRVDVYVNECVYKPSDDTDMLLEALRDLELKNILLALDLGTGSGIIAKILKEIINIPRVVAVDISPYAIRCAKQNLKNDEFLILCNGPSCFKDKTFDLVILNPPYLSPSPEDELFSTGKCKRWFLNSLISSPKKLKMLCSDALRVTKFLSLMVYSSLSPINFIDCITSEGFQPEIVQRKRFFFEELRVVAAWRK